MSVVCLRALAGRRASALTFLAPHLRNSQANLRKYPLMPAKLSVVIPTYNRPQLLRRALRFLRTEGRIPIIVADGSLPDAAETNAATCKGMGGNVPYFHLPSPAGSAAQINNVIQRLSMALSMVKTPYVVFCADDDLLVMRISTGLRRIS